MKRLGRKGVRDGTVCHGIDGSATYDVDGHFVGRVREFFIEPAEQAESAFALFAVARALSAADCPARPSGFGGSRGHQAEREEELEHYRPNEAWLAVRKDLLDQQIIDTSGRKVVRVNDMDLTEQRINGTVELRVTDVDVGLTGRGAAAAAGLGFARR